MLYLFAVHIFGCVLVCECVCVCQCVLEVLQQQWCFRSNRLLLTAYINCSCWSTRRWVATDHTLAGGNTLAGGQVCSGSLCLLARILPRERFPESHLFQWTILCRLKSLVCWILPPLLSFSFFCSLSGQHTIPQLLHKKKMPQQKQQQHHQHPNRAPWSQFSYSRVAYTFSNLMNMVMHCCRAVLWWGGVCWRYSTVLSPSFSVSVNDRRWW